MSDHYSTCTKCQKHIVCKEYLALNTERNLIMDEWCKVDSAIHFHNSKVEQAYKAVVLEHDETLRKLAD